MGLTAAHHRASSENAWYPHTGSVVDAHSVYVPLPNTTSHGILYIFHANNLLDCRRVCSGSMPAHGPAVQIPTSATASQRAAAAERTQQSHHEKPQPAAAHPAAAAHRCALLVRTYMQVAAVVFTVRLRRIFNAARYIWMYRTTASQLPVCNFNFRRNSFIIRSLCRVAR